MGKRGHGEGTIYKRKDGRWTAQISIGKDPKTGKIKRKTLYGKTRKEVQQQMDKIKAELNNGTFVEPSKLTIGEWIIRWLND